MPTSNTAAIDLGYAISLPPADAIAYFESKGYEIGWNWQDVWQEKHTQAFTVAKVARLDILETIRAGVNQVLQDGLTERDFIRALTPQLQKAGWWGTKYITDSHGNTEVVQEGSPHRLKTIYRTNLQTAYQAGRYQQQLDNAEARPYWQYIAIRDSVTRPSHRKFHGRVFRYDDPIWQTLYPPNDWGCRCRVRALSEAQVKRMGLTVENSNGKLITEPVDAGTNKRTGEVYQAEVTRYDDGKTRLTPGAGWSYNVGQSWLNGLLESSHKTLTPLPEELGTAVLNNLNRLLDSAGVFAQWRANPTSAWPLARLPDNDLAVLKGLQPIASISPDTLLKQEREHPELTNQEYLQAQRVIQRASQRIHDGNSLIYIDEQKTDTGNGYVLVVKVTASKQGTWITSYRRLSANEAKRDKELQRLRKKGTLL